MSGSWTFSAPLERGRKEAAHGCPRKRSGWPHFRTNRSVWGSHPNNLKERRRRPARVNARAGQIRAYRTLNETFVRAIPSARSRRAGQLGRGRPLRPGGRTRLQRPSSGYPHKPDAVPLSAPPKSPKPKFRVYITFRDAGTPRSRLITSEHGAGVPGTVGETAAYGTRPGEACQHRTARLHACGVV